MPNRGRLLSPDEVNVVEDLRLSDYSPKRAPCQLRHALPHRIHSQSSAETVHGIQQRVKGSSLKKDANH
jgi:hypothetical protein